MNDCPHCEANRDRATRARTALVPYLAHERDLATAILDLLTDLYHAGQALTPEDWTQIRRLARINYRAELDGDGFEAYEKTCQPPRVEAHP